MPRQARESSGTGIYHVMMRGINHKERRDRFSLRECGDAILSRCSRRGIVNLIYWNSAESLLLAFFLFLLMS